MYKTLVRLHLYDCDVIYLFIIDVSAWKCSIRSKLCEELLGVII